MHKVFIGMMLVLASCGPAVNRTTDGENGDSLSKALFLSKPLNDPRILNRSFEQVPAVSATADGKVMYVAWYSGGEAPGPGNYVTVSVSLDQGKSWLNDQLVVFPNKPSSRIFDPALWRDKDGQVHLFYGSTEDGKLWDGVGGVNTVEINWDGDTLAYSAPPRRLTDGVMSNKPVYVREKNETLFPIYVDKPLPDDRTGTRYPDHGAFVFSSSDGQGGPMANGMNRYASIAIPDSLRIHDEPQLVQLTPQGDFLALVRTTEGIQYAKSTNYGKTWTDVLPFTAAGPTTSSRFFIGRLRSGNIILIMNASTSREKMTAFLSKDGGVTWPYSLLLDARDQVSYPDLEQTDNGDIHVVFDRDRTGEKDILYHRFTEEDILQNSIQNIVKSRVNRP